MGIKEWIAENIGYRFLGCFYNKGNQPLFNFIKSKAPEGFLGKEIHDLGCGDGSNTLRIKKIFKPRSITGYDHNRYCIKRARGNGFSVKELNFNKNLPKGEMAVFTFALHHAKDKQKVLEEATKNYDYLFLCEPVRDIYHALFDGGKPLPRKEWINLFDDALRDYRLYQYKSSLIVFWKK